MKSGVYEIVNTKNGKRYVGSAVNFAYRWRDHRSLLRRGVHHTRHLQRAWEKHGENLFEFHKLLICSKANLLMYEQIAIDELKPAYNVSKVAGSSLGVKHTDQFCEMRRKLTLGKKYAPGRKTMKGFKHSAETRAKLSALLRMRPPILGRKHSAETRAKMSVKAAGRQFSAETREKLSTKARNRHPISEITRAKMRANASGKKASIETRAKISAALLGNKNALRHKPIENTQLAALGHALGDADIRLPSSPGVSGN